MKYKFMPHEHVFTDPFIEVSFVSIDIKNKKCRVDLLLTEDLNEYGVSLDGFTYKNSYSDEQLLDWVFTEIVKYEVD
jgi:hypothetical protein